MRESIFSALLLISFTPLHAAETRTETWTETWPDNNGQLETISVTAEVWTQVFQADLDADGQLHIPAREKPYYLDAPLVMKSGQKLTADAKPQTGHKHLHGAQREGRQLEYETRVRRSTARYRHPHRRRHLEHARSHAR